MSLFNEQHQYTVMKYCRNFIINPQGLKSQLVWFAVNAFTSERWTAIHFDIVAVRDGIITHANCKRHLLYLCSVIYHTLWLVYGFCGAECERCWCRLSTHTNASIVVIGHGYPRRITCQYRYILAKSTVTLYFRY